MSDNFTVGYVVGGYNPSGMPVSPAFGGDLTFDDVIRICDERGYPYTIRENGAYNETYVEVQVEGGKTITFAWEGFGVEEISGLPVYFNIQGPW